jgi:hypothetical protein
MVRNGREKEMSNKVKFGLAAVIAAVTLGGLTPAASAGWRDNPAGELTQRVDDQVVDAVEATFEEVFPGSELEIEIGP